MELNVFNFLTLAQMQKWDIAGELYCILQHMNISYNSITSFIKMQKIEVTGLCPVNGRQQGRQQAVKGLPGGVGQPDSLAECKETES